jgi:flagellar hook-length control protein FliK
VNQFHGDQKLIQLATALPTTPVGPVKPNAAIAAEAGGFALALGALMPKIAVPSAAPQGKPGDPAILLPGRQDVAEGGKELPDAVLGVEGRSEEQAGTDSDSDDSDASTGDAPPPPFAWFASAPAPTAEPEVKAEAAPAVAVEGGAEPRARTGTALPELPVAETVDAPVKQTGAQAPVPQAATSAAPEIRPQTPPAATPAPAQPNSDTPMPASAATAPATAAPVPRAAPVDPVVQAVMADAVTTTDVVGPDSAEPLPQAPRELRQAAADAPVVRITIDRPPLPQKLSIADVAPGVPPAAVASPSVADQIFAAFDRPRGQAGANTAGDPQSALSTLAAPATGVQTAAAVAATGQAQDAPLDTRHQEWTAKMIDKIEMLQGGPVREAKISLMPEGLGKVDIAIRHDDAGLHVQFSTDTPSARQLIADAQPKLAEIAQERGIRIGSTSVDSNAAGSNGGGNGAGTGNGSGTAGSQMNQGQRHDAQPQRNQPSAPLSGQRREASTSTSQDERVA